MFFTVRHELKNTRQLRGMVSSNGVVYFIALDVAKMMEVKNPKLYASFATGLRIRDVIRKELDLKPSVSKIRIFTTGETATLLQIAKSQFANAMGRLLENYKTTRVLRFPNREVPVSDIKKTSCRIKFLLDQQQETTAESEEQEVIIIEEKDHYSEVDSLNNFLRDYTTKCLESYEENKVRVRVEMHIMQPNLKEFDLSAAPESLTVHFGGKVFEYKLV